MKLKVPNKNYDITELFEEIASKMGYLVPDKLKFDCRHVNVAKNIQDGFYAYYMELAKENDPSVSETDMRVGITILLACVGPKVDESLADDEVEVFEGFIC